MAARCCRARRSRPPAEPIGRLRSLFIPNGPVSPPGRVMALRWIIAPWRGTTGYRRGVLYCEVELDAGGGDTFLLAGQQGQRAAIGCGGTVQVQGAWPQPGIADCGDFSRVYERLTD